MRVQVALLPTWGAMWLLGVHIHGGQLNGDIIYYKSYAIYCDFQFTFHKVVVYSESVMV